MRAPGRLAGAILVLALASAVVVVALFLEDPAPVFRIDELASATPHGTPARFEREFKLHLDVPSGPEYLIEKGLESLGDTVFQALQDDLGSPEWQAPRVIGEPYRIDRDPMRMVTRDFYLDTNDSVALDHASALRLRYRFKSVVQLHNHEAAPSENRYFPYRCEVQAKTDRQELGSGFSTVSEARLEFRVESLPFSPENPPPPAPWPPDDFLPIAQSGRYQEMVTTPGQLLASYLQDRGLSGDLRFNVALVLISARVRMHLDITTPYGSGPNPDQAFIISIDRVDVFDGEQYQEPPERALYEQTPRPPTLGTLHEVEIEFERNVSTRIDEIIQKGDDPEAERVRNAFLDDQQRIRLVVARALADAGFRVTDADRSKYQQAQRFVNP